VWQRETNLVIAATIFSWGLPTTMVTSGIFLPTGLPVLTHSYRLTYCRLSYQPDFAYGQFPTDWIFRTENCFQVSVAWYRDKLGYGGATPVCLFNNIDGAVIWSFLPAYLPSLSLFSFPPFLPSFLPSYTSLLNLPSFLPSFLNHLSFLP
jgi:hypothetical protein